MNVLMRKVGTDFRGSLGHFLYKPGIRALFNTGKSSRILICTQRSDRISTAKISVCRLLLWSLETPYRV